MNSCKWDRSKNGLKTKRNVDSSREKRKSLHRLITKPHETEEEAIIRRFHDAQRMARFRARKKKALEEAKVFATLGFKEHSIVAQLKRKDTNFEFETGNPIVKVQNIEQLQTYLSPEKSSTVVHITYNQSRYSQLLRIIEELGKDIKLTYAGSKTSAERLKTGIMQARMLIKECLLETEINFWQ
nr:uncharacterized protein LOC116425720 [Nomia melanderi]